MLRSLAFRFVLSLVPTALLIWFEAADILAALPFLRICLEEMIFAASLALGVGIFIRALAVFYEKKLNEEFFAAISVIFGWALSGYELFMTVFSDRETGRTLLAPCAAVISVTLLSQHFRRKSSPEISAYRLIDALRLSEAAVHRDGGEVRISSSEVCEGDIVSIRPGEIIPCDGEIIAGRSDIDEKTLTGVIVPVYKSEGNTVLAGSRNISGFLTVCASGKSSLDRLAQSYLTAKAPKRSGLSDRFISRLGIICTAVSAAIFLASVAMGYGDFGAFLAGSAALILCPCGFGLSRTFAELAAAGKCLAEGVEIKNPSALSALYGVGEAVIGRTGTATVGKLSVSDVIPLGNIPENGIIRLAAALCAEFDGQDCAAVVSKCKQLEIAVPPCISAERLPGRITGTVDGQRISLSSLPEDALAFEEDYPGAFSKEKAVRVLFLGDYAVGLISLCDALKPNAVAAVNGLTKRGIRTVLVTSGAGGDIESEAKTLGANVWFKGFAPSDKADYIASRQAADGFVMMIGDGVGDAPALRQADFSFALASGAEAAKDSASAILRRNDLRDIFGAINIAASAHRAEKTSLICIIMLRIFAAAFALSFSLSECIFLGVVSLCVGVLISAVPAAISTVKIKAGDKNV